MFKDSISTVWKVIPGRTLSFRKLGIIKFSSAEEVTGVLGC